MHTKKIISAGTEPENAENVLIMLHGRGGNAEDILSLAGYFNLPGFALLAPQATGNSWYPTSFMAPVAQNEPWLSSAIAVIEELVQDLLSTGKATENIYFLGFSQGACLTLEYTARHAKQYGGIIAFTGGLVGQAINPANYQGSFDQTPVFIGTSNPDIHVPVERVHASTTILRNMGAVVTEKVYDNMGHTINQDEIEEAGKILQPKWDSTGHITVGKK